MTWSAWVFMLSVWAVVIGMTLYCFWKLLFVEHLADDDATHHVSSQSSPPLQDRT